MVGVTNSEFRLDSKVDVWTPLQIAEGPRDQSNMYNFVGRLRPGVTLAQAQDDLRRELFQFKSTYPDLWDKDESVRVVDFHDSLVGNMRPALEMSMGAVGLVLAIVSANILSLLLTRSIARRRETSLRLRWAHSAGAFSGNFWLRTQFSVYSAVCSESCWPSWRRRL